MLEQTAEENCYLESIMDNLSAFQSARVWCSWVTGGESREGKSCRDSEQKPIGTTGDDETGEAGGTM
jgi:hypothetical protein